MQQRDYDEFVALLNATAELLAPGRPLSPMAIGMWWRTLLPYDLEGVRQGLDRHMRNPDNGQFMPKPADVVRMMSGGTQDAALVAWAAVDRAVRQVGTYHSVAFDDALIHRVVADMGGWVPLGGRDENEWPFVAKEFENRYRGYRMRSETPAYPPVLIGTAEAHNARSGYRSAPPVLIGNADRALAVIAGGNAEPLLGFTRPNEAVPPALRLAHSSDRRAA